MSRLYVTQQAARIHTERGKITVTLKDEVISSVSTMCVDAVCVFGHVQLTTQLIHHCLVHRKPIAYFSVHGRYMGSLIPAMGRNAPLRIAQVKAMEDPEFAMRIARAMIGAKIRNCHRFLMRQVWNHKALDFGSELAEMKKLQRAAGRCAGAKDLRAVEGRAARIYFRCLSAVIGDRAEFTGRVRRPPRGLFNILLSLGYSLLSAECASAVEGAGLDPCIGALHTLRYGRPSLGLDLVEEFRTPVAERLAVRLITNRYGEFHDCEDADSVLPEPALKRFFRVYEEMVTRPATERESRLTLRQAIHRQAGKLAACYRTGTSDYAPHFYR